MSTTTIERGRRGAAAVLATVALTGAGATVVDTAGAAPPKAGASYVRKGVSGKPGRVGMLKVQGWAGQGWHDWGLNLLRINAPSVYRSSATRGTQTLCVDLDIYKFIASTPGHGPNPWRHQESRRGCRDVGRGYYWPNSLGRWDYSAQPFVSYSVNIVVRWFNGAGRMIGKATYDYNNAAGDYQCMTAKCYTVPANGSGGIYFDV